MEQNLYDQFMKCQDKLYRYSLLLTQNVVEAEDIYQETLLKLWELKDEWCKWQSFEAYSMRMVKNSFLNFIKKKASRTFVSFENIEEVNEQNDTEKQITILDLKFKFQALISQLPEIQRSILFLREIEELDYKEIADILHLSESQVKVYLFRGRQSIKKRFNSHE